MENSEKSEGKMSEPIKKHRTISERYEEDSKALMRAVGVKRKFDVSGLLEVIEFELKVRKKTMFFVQIILNPWAHLDVPPKVHLLGVDADDTRTWLASPINTAEGRYKLEIEAEWAWPDDPNLVKFWDDCISPAIRTPELHDLLTYRKSPKSTGAYGLFFPSGVANLAEQLDLFAKKKGWRLVNREESKIIEAKRLALEEAEKLNLDAKLKKLNLEIENAVSEEELRGIQSKLENDAQISEELRVRLLERIEARMSEVEPHRIDFDRFAKTPDPTRGFSNRGTRIREWPSEDWSDDE
jgi:hypothetical protein